MQEYTKRTMDEEKKSRKKEASRKIERAGWYSERRREAVWLPAALAS